MVEVKIRNYYMVYYIWDFNNNQYLHTDGIWRKRADWDTGFFPDLKSAILMAESKGCRVVETREAPPEIESDEAKEARLFIESLFQER